jgi:hypothetical protein
MQKKPPQGYVSIDSWYERLTHGIYIPSDLALALCIQIAFWLSRNIRGTYNPSECHLLYTGDINTVKS